MNATITTTVDLQNVKRALLTYAKADRWNNNSAYSLGFNDMAQGLIDRVANGDYGFPSEIAQTVSKYGYKISEKQAYWIAKAGVENNLCFDKKGELYIIFE